MTQSQQGKIEEAAKKLANEYCYPSNEIIEVTRNLIHEYIITTFKTGVEFALNELSENSGEQETLKHIGIGKQAMGVLGHPRFGNSIEMTESIINAVHNGKNILVIGGDNRVNLDNFRITEHPVIPEFQFENETRLERRKKNRKK